MAITVTPELIEQLASLSGMAIAPEHLPGVMANIATLLERADELMAEPIRPEVEPAPIFVP